MHSLTPQLGTDVVDGFLNRLETVWTEDRNKTNIPTRIIRQDRLIVCCPNKCIATGERLGITPIRQPILVYLSAEVSFDALDFRPAETGHFRDFNQRRPQRRFNPPAGVRFV